MGEICQINNTFQTRSSSDTLNTKISWLKNKNTASTMVKIEELNRKRYSAKKKFDDEVKNFEIVLEARPEISRLEEAFGEIKRKYKAISEVHDQITELMLEAEIEITEFTNHDSFITAIIEKYGDLHAKLEYYRNVKWKKD